MTLRYMAQCSWRCRGTGKSRVDQKETLRNGQAAGCCNNCCPLPWTLAESGTPAICASCGNCLR